jgi:hypothetical protein
MCYIITIGQGNTCKERKMKNMKYEVVVNHEFSKYYYLNDKEGHTVAFIEYWGVGSEKYCYFVHTYVNNRNNKEKKFATLKDAKKYIADFLAA